MILSPIVPAVWDELIEELLEDRAGLLPAIAAVSDAYNKGTGRPPRDDAALAARLAFFLRADLPKAGVCVAECQAAGIVFPSPLKVLDAGAGLGAAGLGAVEALRAGGHEGRIHVVSLDDDAAALELGHALWKKAAVAGLGDVTHEPRLWSASDARASLGPAPYDLIVAGALLCELGQAPDALVDRLLGALAPGGVLILIEPALRETSRALHALRDRLMAKGGLTIVAPCTRSGPCPALLDERDWCHEDRPFSPSPEMARLTAAMGLRRGGLKFSYLILREEGPSLGDASGLPHPDRVVSDLIVTKGKLEVWLCGPDGRRKLTRLKRDRSDANAPLSEARRGDLVSIDAPKDATRIGPESTVDRWKL